MSSATDSIERTMPVPGAHRAGLGRTFEHAGTQALARHLHQAEMTDAPDLDPRAVVARGFLQPPLDQAVVASLVHVDEVDDDQPGKVAQASWRAISSAASRLVLSAVSSILCSRVALPELTSMATNASV